MAEIVLVTYASRAGSTAGALDLRIVPSSDDRLKFLIKYPVRRLVHRRPPGLAGYSFLGGRIASALDPINLGKVG